MYIKRIDCKTFAGINRVKKDLNKGLNVILGDNESGKSTLTDFIFHILFTRHDFDSRSAASFESVSFPVKADGSSPSSIEGSLFLDVDGEEYEISKTWSKTDKKRIAKCKLDQPKGTLNAEEAEEAIRSLLKFGAGTYRETVFSSQRDERKIAEILLAERDKDKTKDVIFDFSRALANAALETPGVSSGKLLKALETARMPYKTGWDIEKGKPSGKSTNDPKAVMRPLYDLKKSIEDAMQGVEEAENEYDSLKNQLSDLEREKAALAENLRNCRRFSQLKKEKDEMEEKLQDTAGRLRKESAALRDWPDYADKLTKALQYKRQLADAETVSRYNEVKALKDICEKEAKALKALRKVEDSDIACLENLEKKIEAERSKLGGMNIDLDISEIDEEAVRFSYYNGEKIEARANTSLEVNRAVSIEVSDKLKMQIKPRNIDTKNVLGEIEKARRDLAKKCGEFSCETIVMVKDLKAQYDRQEKRSSQAQEAYSNALKKYNTTWAELEEQKKGADSELERDAVMVHVKELGIPGNDLEQGIANWQAEIRRYEEEYRSPEELKGRIREQEEEGKKLKERLGEIDIPKEIEEMKEEELDSLHEEKKRAIESLRNGDLFHAKSALADKKPLAAYRTELADIEREYETAEREGRRWNEILKRFEETKEDAARMDVSSLKEGFANYLKILTGERLSVDELSDTLELRLASGDNLLNDQILSNGTRETIELAFRLAMLEELFPDGGGFAVFDDSLVNMDPDRTRRACSALKEFAKKNQLLFLTCHPEYASLLEVKEASVIRM